MAEIGFFAIIQLAIVIVCLVLVYLSWDMYQKTSVNQFKLFMFAFICITVVSILRLFLPGLEATILPPGHEIYETMIESIQFLAAFFFAWAFVQLFREIQERKEVSS